MCACMASRAAGPSRARMAARMVSCSWMAASQDGPEATDLIRDADGVERPTIDVRGLMSGAREAILTLDGEEYRLRITAKEKLILTK